MIGSLTLGRQISVFRNLIHIKRLQGIDIYDITFNKKIRKNIYLRKVFAILLSFPSLFRWVLVKIKELRFLDGVYIAQSNANEGLYAALR